MATAKKRNINQIKNSKNKSINEKNIKNEITKFEIVIISEIEITSKNTELIEKITLSNSGVYEVGSKHTQTLTNERSLIKSLTKTHIDEIIEELILNQVISKSYLIEGKIENLKAMYFFMRKFRLNS